MTHPQYHDDAIAPHLLPPTRDGAALELRYKTGRVVSWDGSDGYRVQVDDVVVTVTSVDAGPWVDHVLPGNTVSMLATVDGRGAVTYAVTGLRMTPAEAVAIAW